MAGMGPAPKPESTRRRRNSSSGGRKLPAEGRAGAAPAWPLSRATKAELEVWSAAWATPQAVAWEQLGWFRTVGRYCRALVAAEKRDAPAARLSEVRQLEDRLGLSPMSMHRLGWEIAVDELAEARDERPSVRDRLRPVD